MKEIEKLDNNFIIEAKDFSKYGKEFQFKLTSLLIKDKTFAYSIINIIKDSYFNDIYLKVIFKVIENYYSKYHSSPTIEDIKVILTTNGEKIILYEKLLKQIDEIDLGNKDFIIENAQNFCFTKYALSELEKSISALKKGEFIEAKKIAFESFMSANLDNAKIFNIKKDVGKIFEKKKYGSYVQHMFKTFNDNSNKGKGMSEGTLCVVVAPSNLGKSNYLAALARDICFKGTNVLYYTYEESGEVIMEKFLAGLMDIVRDEIEFNQEQAYEVLKNKALANLYIVEDKGRNATLANQKSQLSYVKSCGFFPEVILIDGLNQCKLPKGIKAKDDNEKFEIITEDLKDWFKEEQLSGVAVFQTNRSGWTSELNNEQTIGKAIEVFQKADQVITLTQPPHLKLLKQIYVYLLKNRYGEKEICLLVDYDPAKVLFIELEVLNPLVLQSSETKKVVKKSISQVREKLKVGTYDNK